MKITEEYNLGKLYPNLVKEWHPTKNKGLNPFQVAPASRKKVWWMCEKGHEWEASVYNRKYGGGCPYCSGKKPTKEYNFAVLHPDLAEEWHPTKNGKLQPEDVMPASRREVWWKCKEGHEWKSSLEKRHTGSICPVCYKQKRGEIRRKAAIKKSGNLAEKYPQIAKQWHPTKNGKLTPYDFAPKSHKKIWWKCKQGHVWEARIAGRTRGGGCPYCAGQRATKENNLAKHNPELAREWHPTKNGKLKPEDLMPHSGKKVWWMCKKGHEWEASLDNRSRGTGCPYCAGKRKV